MEVKDIISSSLSYTKNKVTTMRRIIEHLRARDWSHVLIVLGGIAAIASIWLVSASVLNRPSQYERHMMMSRHKGEKSHATAKPKGADVPITKPFVADYTLPMATDGLAPVVTRIETQQPVVFLTIDDGAYQDESVVKVLRAHRLKASLFLSKLFIGRNPDFFKQITAQGSLIENHTLSHDLKMVKDMNYDQQKAEICGMADYEQQTYGRRPIFYRPPGGGYTTAMRQAAHDCGMKAVVTWMVTVNNGSLQYQIGNTLRAGDIVLMHFRPTFTEDIQAFVDAAKIAGLHTELLEDAIIQ